MGALDIGGTKLAAAVVSDEGVVIARRSRPTALYPDPTLAVVALRAMLSECEAECGRRIEGIGIGCTGPVDPFTGSLGVVDLLPGWDGYPLVSRLNELTGVSVALENDADAGVLAESQWGAGKGASHFLYVTVGTGIGVGAMINGRLYRGAGGVHPEAGHMTIDSSGPSCYCGTEGCWESLASGPALAAWAQRNAPIEWFNDGGGARGIFELAQKGDAFAREVVDRECHYLGIGLANLITAFCPDRIALGGGVMEGADLLLTRTISIARTRCGLVPVDRIAIVRATLGADAPLLGAAQVWHHRTLYPLEVSC